MLVAFRALDEEDCEHLDRMDVEMSAILQHDERILDPCGFHFFKARLSRGRSSYLNWFGVAAFDSGEDYGFAVSSIQSAPIKRITDKKRKRYARIKYVELFWINVMKENRRKGVGAALINRVCEEAKVVDSSCSEVRLHVLTTNEDAILFYNKIGFHTMSIKKNYPTKPYSCIRMRRSFDL